MLHGSEERSHQDRMVILAANLASHQVVRRAPDLMSGEALVVFERDTSHEVRQLAEGPQSSYRIAVFIELENTLIGIGDLTEEKGKQVLTSILINHLQIIKQPCVQVVLLAKVLHQNLIVVVFENVSFEGLDE